MKYANLTKVVRQTLTEDVGAGTDDMKLYASVYTRYAHLPARERPTKAAVRRAKWRVLSISPELSGSDAEREKVRYRTDHETMNTVRTLRGVPVKCSETGRVYESIRSAALETGIGENNITQCVTQAQKTAGGYHWEYEKRPSTLCWKCRRAYAGRGCPWADAFLPVPGWTAVQCTRTYCEKEEITYTVISCPLFRQEER